MFKLRIIVVRYITSKNYMTCIYYILILYSYYTSYLKYLNNDNIEYCLKFKLIKVLCYILYVV